MRAASGLACRWLAAAVARNAAALARSFAVWDARRAAQKVVTRKVRRRQRLFLLRLFRAWGDITALRAHRAQRVRGAVARRRREVEAAVVGAWRGVACAGKRLRVIGRRVIVRLMRSSAVKTFSVWALRAGEARRGRLALRRCQPSTLNPQPSTLNPQPSTLNPHPSTLIPKPSTLNPKPYTLHPEP